MDDQRLRGGEHPNDTRGVCSTTRGTGGGTVGDASSRRSGRSERSNYSKNDAGSRRSAAHGWNSEEESSGRRRRRKRRRESSTSEDFDPYHHSGNSNSSRRRRRDSPEPYQERHFRQRRRSSPDSHYYSRGGDGNGRSRYEASHSSRGQPPASSSTRQLEYSTRGNDISGNTSRSRYEDGHSAAQRPSSSSVSSRHRRRTNDRNSEEAPKPSSAEWPPEFSENGASYVLDPRSSMFYDVTSQFFFDPVSRLYYGVKQQAYFQYDPTKTWPPFQRVNGSDDSGTDLSSGQHQTTSVTSANTSGPSQESCSDGTSGAPKQHVDLIKINLLERSKRTTKSSSPSTDPSEISSGGPSVSVANHSECSSGGGGTATAVVSVPSVETPAHLNLAQKQQKTNMKAWGKRKKEDIQPTGGVCAESSGAPTVPEKDFATTPSGEPICLLCKRKFKNLGMLKMHEEVSKLHLENLTKVSQKDNKAPPVSAPTAALPDKPKYQDRAKARQAMHGGFMAPIYDPRQHLAKHAAETRTSKPAADNQKQDMKDTIGSKMFEAMAARKEPAKPRLGTVSATASSQAAAEVSGSATSGNNSDEQASSSSGVDPSFHQRIRQDWGKIESLSAKGSQSQNRHKATFAQAGIGYGHKFNTK